MCFTLCCTDCGHRMKVNEQSAESDITCEKCGAVMHYRVQNETMLVRMKKYASLIMPHDKRTLKIVCPVCGCKIGQSADGTYSIVPCPKCRSRFVYEVKNDDVYLQVLQSPEKQSQDKNSKRIIPAVRAT